MTDLSDVVLAQNKTTILLRAFLKIFQIYFVSALVIGLAGAGYLYYSLHNLSGCVLAADGSSSCSTSSMPRFCLYIIAIFAIGSVILTFVTIDKALGQSEPESKQV